MKTRQEMVQDRETFLDRARGVMSGLAIGDSFGDASRKPDNQLAYGITTDFGEGASWSTDDTEFGLLTAQTLIEANGRLTPEIVAEAWKKHVVTQGEVLIVDEHTGRILPGRRYNEGLHQAIEAKEGVEVKAENQTFATITLQNYFRMYDKLAGMTGTAETEAAEFMGTYKLGVLPIPTNKPMIREDKDDLIFRTKKEKLAAIVRDVAKRHKKGQPVLLGTASVESSEVVSSLLDVAKIPHQVLNAKQHDKEAAVVAVAGRKGAVTVATNMAGRGTDIMLGGNVEFLADAKLKSEGYSPDDTPDEYEKRWPGTLAEIKDQVKDEHEEVVKLGGLYVLGTERHESRRIDNQLRGRAGRQGDPGASRFYLSLEDDLMRLFGGERINGLMETLGIDEDTPIENKMLTRSIEGAQRRVEERNFGIRRNVLQYDDVMNRQREIIYSQRDQVLDGESVKDSILKMLVDSFHANAKTYTADEDHTQWNLEGLRDYFRGWIGTDDDFQYTAQELEDMTPEEIVQPLIDRALKVYEEKEELYGSEIMRELERVILLKTVDRYWMDHIDNMDELRKGIHLRAYGQKDPVVLYRIEGFDMFDGMIAAIQEDTVRLMLTVQIRQAEEPKREQVAKETGTSADGTDAPRTVRKRASEKVGRNDPCPCGSGKKYKKCCGRTAGDSEE